MPTADSLARIMARRNISRADLVVILVFAYGHPETSLIRAIHDFVRGIGPAAIAAGRAR